MAEKIYYWRNAFGLISKKISKEEPKGYIKAKEKGHFNKVYNK